MVWYCREAHVKHLHADRRRMPDGRPCRVPVPSVREHSVFCRPARAETIPPFVVDILETPPRIRKQAPCPVDAARPGARGRRTAGRVRRDTPVCAAGDACNAREAQDDAASREGCHAMKIAWIVPRARPCGISYYADQYAAALSKQVSLVECDPEEFVKDRKSLADKVSGCDLAHLQYDPSFFFKGGNDFFPALCRSIRCKKIITVHEVYRIVPGVFPRENMKGVWPVKRAKQWLWDFRHPHWAAFSRHAAHNFFADAILVHARFHRAILAARGVDESKITVIPLPVRSWSNGAAPLVFAGRAHHARRNGICQSALRLRPSSERAGKTCGTLALCMGGRRAPGRGRGHCKPAAG